MRKTVEIEYVGIDDIQEITDDLYALCVMDIMLVLI